MRCSAGIAMPSLSLDNTSTVELVVEHNDQTKTFQVHEELLFTSSPYFPAAFQSSFEEATTRKLRITDFDPKIVLLFINWLYFRTLPEWDDGSDEEEETPDDPQCTELCVLAIFADRFQTSEIAQHIFKYQHGYFAKGIKLMPGFADVQLIFEKLPDTSKFRKLYVDVYALSWKDRFDDSGERRRRSSVPLDFWIQLSLKLTELRDKGKRKGLPDLSEYEATNEENDETPQMSE